MLLSNTLTVLSAEADMEHLNQALSYGTQHIPVIATYVVYPAYTNFGMADPYKWNTTYSTTKAPSKEPAPDFEPFNFLLTHTICLVTAYSESVEGLRTTLDSLATTDYPNSHKLILVIVDGIVKGAGNTMTMPEICLSMMKDFIIQPHDVETHSYVAIADGHKRHNMAKVYASFYDYDDASVERSKQQCIPMVVVAKVGNLLEANDAKPGNRGKHDSQIVLMAFLQKVMFDERMTTFEYEFFNYSKVFLDSLTCMVSCMVVDIEIMGLCGEMKIANKADNFMTMMQVFKYYISHLPRVALPMSSLD
ncbi:chitin synthase-domain-containing protein [Suillus paluster]|uniref:chitin synthase-domain-containing protein n=1 Tax=Suillus paluster TaxID=48578 RepID=UPI001B8723D6|nr:chitin synthase-domain-containing protein [Suillus paluster]KAG1727586.1 chitin synthase-domain-containing protein [Suillus paluster]